METNPFFNTTILAQIFHIVFVILFAQPLLKTPCCLLTILPFLPIVRHVHCSAASSLPLAGPAGWWQGGQGRHKASCQTSDKQLARAEELAESSCWLCCAGLLAEAVAASMLLGWKPHPAPRKAVLLNSLPFLPLLPYTARTPQVLLQEQGRGFPNAVSPTHWRKLARNLSKELPKGSKDISAADAGTCEYLHSHSSFLSAGFSSLCLPCW